MILLSVSYPLVPPWIYGVLDSDGPIGPFCLSSSWRKGQIVCRAVWELVSNYDKQLMLIS